MKARKVHIYEDANLHICVLIKFTVLFLGDTKPVNAWYLARMQSQIRYQS